MRRSLGRFFDCLDIRQNLRLRFGVFQQNRPRAVTRLAPERWLERIALLRE
jgi:hypothetical protein